MKFIKMSGWLCAGALLQACAGAAYVAGSSDAKRITIKKTEFDRLKNGKTLKRDYIIVKAEQLGFHICIYRLNDEQYSALWMECTHKGCELQPHGDYLVCPCHGSEFSKTGKVQNPPAEQDLKLFTVTHDAENIYVQL